ncbi:MAG: hypothetical protein HC866_04755 [Leptolyngbyaceae cyanobacterium RU_5_1]|nr:hypothetical protein [Leptolyngbyaceae cyanobacterium RU_5_1]
MSSAWVVPFQQVKAIGTDAMIVPSRSSVVRARELPEVQQILQRHNILKGTYILTTGGQHLGKMLDLYFDDRTGVIEGYEVSGGLFADVYTGRSFVPAHQTLKIGEDFAFVPPETVELMEEQVGGVRGAMLAAGEKIQEAAQTTTATLQAAGEKVSETVQEAAQTTGEALQSATEDVKYRLQETQQAAIASATNLVVDPTEQKAFAIGKPVQETVTAPDGTLIATAGQVVTLEIAVTAEQSGILDQLYRATGGRLSDDIAQKASGAVAGYVVEQALGRRVQRMVRTREGNIIAAPGQIVTERVIEQTKHYRKEYELLDAVGLSTGEAARYSATDRMAIAGNRVDTATQALGEQLQRGTEQVKIEARNLWQQLRETSRILQERSTRTVEERRIREALGRPVTRVILDNQDNVILNTGDLITHQAIAAAREVGVLDILLGSVYHQTPRISERELRAPEPGEASLGVAS